MARLTALGALAVFGEYRQHGAPGPKGAWRVAMLTFKTLEYSLAGWQNIRRMVDADAHDPAKQGVKYKSNNQWTVPILFYGCRRLIAACRNLAFLLMFWLMAVLLLC